jgi:hypothetical protein
MEINDYKIKELTPEIITQSLLEYVGQLLEVDEGGTRSLKITRTEHAAVVINGQESLIDLEVGIQKHPVGQCIDEKLNALDVSERAFDELLTLLGKVLWVDLVNIAKAILDGLKPLGAIHVAVADEDSVIFAFSTASVIVMMHRKPN